MNTYAGENFLRLARAAVMRTHFRWMKNSIIWRTPDPLTLEARRNLGRVTDAAGALAVSMVNPFSMSKCYVMINVIKFHGAKYSFFHKCITGEVGPVLNKADTMSQDDINGMNAAPPIWCLACKDNLIVAATGDGRIEVISSYLSRSQGPFTAFCQYIGVHRDYCLEWTRCL